MIFSKIASKKRQLRLRSLYISASKFVFQEVELDAGLDVALKTLLTQKGVSRQDACMAIELACSQACYDNDNSDTVAFYAKEAKYKDYQPDLWRDMAEARASVALARAAIHLTIRSQAPEFSYMGAVYRSEKLEGARLDNEEAFDIEQLTTELAEVEAEIQRKTAEQNRPRVSLDAAEKLSLKSTIAEIQEELLTAWIEVNHPNYTEQAVIRRLHESKGNWITQEDEEKAQELSAVYRTAESKVFAADTNNGTAEDEMTRLKADAGFQRMRIDALINGPFTRAEIQVKRQEALEDIKRALEE